MNKKELMEETEILMNDIDERLDILQDRIDEDMGPTETIQRFIDTLQEKRDDLEADLKKLEDRGDELTFSEQEEFRLKIEDLKMSIERAIEDLE